MDLKREQNIAYAEGFVEDIIESKIAILKEENLVEHAAQIANMWQVLSQGLNEYRRENAALQQKLFSAKLAIG
jgi:hypothetical protein